MSDQGEETAAATDGRRSRKRNSIPADKHDAIVKQVLDEYDTELRNRGPERERRLQRYAKYRLWTETSDWPWPDASNCAVPDMLQDSLRLQDTLHNAVMSQKPPVLAKGTTKGDDENADMVNDLLQYQVFVEQPGEKLIGDLIEGFINDPAATVYIPWVRDKRKMAETTLFDAIPDDQSAAGLFPKPAAQRLQRRRLRANERRLGRHGGDQGRARCEGFLLHQGG
jgi:hypothetical protein